MNGLVGMVGVRESGCVIHYTYESPRKNRSTSMCVFGEQLKDKQQPSVADIQLQEVLTWDVQD